MAMEDAMQKGCLRGTIKDSGESNGKKKINGEMGLCWGLNSGNFCKGLEWPPYLW